MILATLLNIATTISISASSPTTLIFNDPIQFVSIGKSGDFSLFISNNKKLIIIQPLKDLKLSEMAVVSEDKNYQFKIHIENEKTNNYYQVLNGKPNSSFTLLKKDENYEIYEGLSSMMFKNTSDKELQINGETVKPRSSVYLPKGESLYLNTLRIL